MKCDGCKIEKPELRDVALVNGNHFCDACLILPPEYVEPINGCQQCADLANALKSIQDNLVILVEHDQYWNRNQMRDFAFSILKTAAMAIDECKKERRVVEGGL